MAAAEGLVATLTVPFDERAAWAGIAAVHDPAYVEAILTGEPRELAESQNFEWSADRVQPALVQYRAGMDPFEDDPVGGIDGITEAFLIERDRFVIEQVRARGIPLVVNLAGGYVRGVSERLHVNTVRVMRDPPCHSPPVDCL